MKKIVITLAVAAATLFAFSSCQKENLTNTSNNGVRVITATFENDGTKTTLNADGKTPEWAVGDVLRVLSATSYQDVTLAAGDITDNKITFTTTLTGTLYAVYPASATTMESCGDGNISFTIPAIQDGSFASANICVAKSSTTDGTNKDNLVFCNATSVLKITTPAEVVGVDVTTANSIAGAVTASFSGSELSLTTTSLDKKYVSAVGTSAPSGNVFYLAAAPLTTGSATVNCYKTDKKGTAAKDSKALARNAIYSMDLTSVTIDNPDLTGQRGNLNGHEYVIIKCGDKNLKWATMNIGATALTGADSYGDLFSWGDIEKKDNYQKSYYIDPAKSLSSNITPDSGNDVARVKWGGTWRMPTGNEGEFKALKEATYWQWDTTDKGYYVYDPQTGDAGKKNNESSNTYNKSDALLFFPAAGYCSNTSRFNVGTYGSYWSSTWSSSNDAYNLFFQIDKVESQGSYNRYCGRSVRPVSD